MIPEVAEPLRKPVVDRFFGVDLRRIGGIGHGDPDGIDEQIVVGPLGRQIGGGLRRLLVGCLRLRFGVEPALEAEVGGHAKDKREHHEDDQRDAQRLNDGALGGHGSCLFGFPALRN